MKNLIILLFVTVFMQSCCEKYSRDDFSFDRMNYISNDLKINGYYYKHTYDNNYRVFFLFRNGIYFDGVYEEATNLKGLDSVIVSSYGINSVNLPYAWGIFRISNNNIKIEKWISGDTCEPYPVTSYEGRVLNDTTIQFSDNHFGTMKFRHLTPKPDSTTEFID